MKIQPYSLPLFRATSEKTVLLLHDATECFKVVNTCEGTFVKARSSLRLLYLIECALIRAFIRPPSNEFCSVAEAAAGYVVEPHLHHKLRSNGLPLGRSCRRPSARASRSFAGESGRFAECLQLLG